MSSHSDNGNDDDNNNNKHLYAAYIPSLAPF